MTRSQAILDFAAAPHRLEPKVREATLRLLGDSLLVGAAGLAADGREGVLATARGWGQGGEARLIGAGERLPATAAAYVNGFSVHALEWDAVHEKAVVHAVSGVVCALGAAIDRRGGCDPEAALAALAVGVDVAAGLGLSATSPLTFFRPAVCTIFGAALAVARIEELPAAQFADVLGLAHCHAAGTMQAHTEGSSALPLQFANAVRGALHAVDLVRHGLTGPHNVLEGPFGHFALFDRGDLSRYTERLGALWRIGEVSTKPWPSGRASHAMLGALAELRREGLDLDSVERIECFVPPLILHLVGRAMGPGMDPAYARLCLPFLCGLMLRDGAIDPRAFTAQSCADPALLALAARVIIVSDGNGDANALGPQRIVVTTKTGQRAEQTIPATVGSPAAPMDPALEWSKRELAIALAGGVADHRLLDDPLAYFTDPK